MNIPVTALVVVGVAITIYTVVVWHLRVYSDELAESRQGTIDALKSNQTHLFEGRARAEKEALTAERRVAELEKQLAGVREIVAPAQTEVRP